MRPARSTMLVILTPCILGITVGISTAENLHQKYRELGMRWDCSYISAGEPYAKACADCEHAGMEFDLDLQKRTGQCVPGERAALSEQLQKLLSRRKSRPQRPVVHRDWNYYYGAIAVGQFKYKEDSTVFTLIVSGFALDKPSQDEAIEKAITLCKEAHTRPHECTLKATFSNGACGYVSIGNAIPKDDWSSNYGVAATKDRASTLCSHGGRYDCGDPSGGCTKRPD